MTDHTEKREMTLKEVVEALPKPTGAEHPTDRAYKEYTALREALEWFFEMLDTSVFLRNTAGDIEPDWAIHNLKIVAGLQKAKAALAEDVK